jgi:hypothetical protein
MPNDDTQLAPPPRSRPARATLAWILVLILAGLVAWLASERNARLFYLVPDGEEIVVKKGMFLPFGRQAIHAEEPGLKAYAPVKPPAGYALGDERSFDDRASLDQGLYELLASWARADITGDQHDQLDRGLAYLARAEQLPGISAAQREDLRSLRAESSYFEARSLLEQGSELLRKAREKLRVASEGAGRHASQALLLLRRLEPVVEGAVDAWRDLEGKPARAEAGTTAPAAPAPEPPKAAATAR